MREWQLRVRHLSGSRVGAGGVIHDRLADVSISNTGSLEFSDKSWSGQSRDGKNDAALDRLTN